MSGKARGRTIQTQLKPSPLTTTGPEALAQTEAPTTTPVSLDPDALKLDLLASVRNDIALIIKTELQEVLGDALSPIKTELQAVKAQLTCDKAATDAKVAKLADTVGDMEVARSGCTDDIVDMKRTVERLAAKVNSLEDKCEDLESRSRRNNIRILGVEEGKDSCSPTAVAALLKRALALDEEPLVDRSHRTLQPKPKPGERPRAIVCKLHYYSDCVDILRRAREMQRIKVGASTISIFPDYTAKVARARAAFNEVKRLLRSIEGARYGLYHPAQLRVSYKGVEKVFSSSEDAKQYVKTLNPG